MGAIDAQRGMVPQESGRILEGSLTTQSIRADKARRASAPDHWKFMTTLESHHHATAHDRARLTTSFAVIAGLLLTTIVSVATPFGATRASAAHPDLTLEIISAPNFVVDSNIESPSSYGPEAAHVAAKVCNTGSDTMTDVLVISGDFDPDGVGGYADSTPGTYPAKTHPGLTGTFSFTHEGGPADATRFIGNLARRRVHDAVLPHHLSDAR